jgi:hypothetical protein
VISRLRQLDEDKAEASIAQVAEEFGVDFPVIYDGEGWYGANASEWCVEAIPATFLVDPQGRLIARDVDPSQVHQRSSGPVVIPAVCFNPRTPPR